MSSTAPTKGLRWFHYRIVWLVVAIPALTVLGCLLTIYLAISSPDQLVADPAADIGSNDAAAAATDR